MLGLSLYIDSAGDMTALFGIYDTMQYLNCDVAPSRGQPPAVAAARSTLDA